MTEFPGISVRHNEANGIDISATASHRQPAENASDRTSVIRAGRNAWKAAMAQKASFLIDGAAYFSALDQTLRQAQHSIWIVGWDFNPDIRLRPHQSSETLGELLLTLAHRNSGLQVRILIWGMGPVYSGKSLRLFSESGLSSHPQIGVRFDFRHPLRGCHHQKLVSIDDGLAFLGGIDLTARRWDEPDHRVDNSLRTSPDGKPYGPVHDMQLMVSGDAAKLIGDVARRRWKRAAGEAISPSVENGNVWPGSVGVQITDVPAAIALTEPGFIGRRGRHEVFRLTRDAVRSARRHIYIETQYLASFRVARAIAKRLREVDGPEIVVLATKSSHGLIEKLTMGSNRDRLIRRLKRMDRYDRLRVMYAVVPNGEGGTQEVVIHSKLIIIDDNFVRVGSSNLNNRSEGLDTECDIALEAGNLAHRNAISGLRDGLMAEHLDTTPEAVRQMVAEKRSLIRALDTLNIRQRGLRDFAVDLSRGEISPMIGTGLVDPRRPYWPLQRLRLRIGLAKARLLNAIF